MLTIKGENDKFKISVPQKATLTVRFFFNFEKKSVNLSQRLEEDIL